MIENEAKYVLNVNCKIDDAMAGTTIMQGYDKNGARVRNQDGIYTFNYKMKAGDYIEEFEMKISKEEFDRCYSTFSNTLEKTRYTIKDDFSNTWDIDFFKSDNEIYFVMAECEMSDPTTDYPTVMLPFVENNLLYTVPRADSRKFSSRKLTDVNYAKNILSTLK